MKPNDSFYENVVSIPRPQLIRKTIFAVFVFITVFMLPFYIHNQIVTGSLVNAGLLISISLFGMPTALVLCIVPSIIALLKGLLPMAFVPILPFIMIGNFFYVSMFNALSRRKIMGIILGSGVKFAFLYGVGQILLSHIIVPNLFQKASLMLGWFQLITALLGGCIAFSILTIYHVKK